MEGSLLHNKHLDLDTWADFLDRCSSRYVSRRPHLTCPRGCKPIEIVSEPGHADAGYCPRCMIRFQIPLTWHERLLELKPKYAPGQVSHWTTLSYSDATVTNAPVIWQSSTLTISTIYSTSSRNTFL